MSNSPRTSEYDIISPSPRLRRELETFQAMIAIYCRAHHNGAKQLCVDCQEVLEYARRRLDCCRFGEEKPVCSDCPVHCYRPGMKSVVKQVMRFAGPRMLLRHPILALRHQWDRFIHRQPTANANK